MHATTINDLWSIPQRLRLERTFSAVPVVNEKDELIN